MPCSRTSGTSVSLTSEAETGALTTKSGTVFPLAIKGQQEPVHPRHGDRETTLGIGPGGIAPGFHVSFMDVETARIAVPVFNFADFVAGDPVGVPNDREIHAGGRAALRVEHAAGQGPGTGIGSRRSGDQREGEKHATAKQHDKCPRKPAERQTHVRRGL